MRRGDQRAALERRFDDDREPRERGDDAIALGKRARVRSVRPAANSDSTSPRLDDLALERRVRRGYGDVDAGAEHGDGRAAGVERGAVRGGVDAERHAADDARAGARERRAQSRA